MVLPTLDRETALTWVIGDCCVFVTKVVSLVSVKTETPAIYQHNGIHGVALWKGEGGAFVVADSSAKEAFEVTEGGEWTKQGQEERVWSVRDGLLLEVGNLFRSPVTLQGSLSRARAGDQGADPACARGNTPTMALRRERCCRRPAAINGQQRRRCSC